MESEKCVEVFVVGLDLGDAALGESGQDRVRLEGLLLLLIEVVIRVG